MVHIKLQFLITFVFPFYGRGQPPPWSGSRGKGSAAGVLLFQPPVAGVVRLQPFVEGANARYEDVYTSSYHRSRPKTHSVRANFVDFNDNAFVIVVSVAIDDVAAGAGVAAAFIVVVAAVLFMLF